jgi:hypothetical protein
MIDPSTGESGCAMVNSRKVVPDSTNLPFSFATLFAGAPEVAAFYDAMVRSPPRG